MRVESIGFHAGPADAGSVDARPPGAGVVRDGRGAFRPSRPSKLLDRVREVIRARHYSASTEKAYVGWVRRYVLFHGKRHPETLGEAEITGFLSALATRRRVSVSTQNQALCALLFLYRDVLGREMAWMDGIVRAKRPIRLPVVLSRDEIRAIPGQMNGTPWLMASLMYGAGLRLMECCRLRVVAIASH